MKRNVGQRDCHSFHFFFFPAPRPGLSACLPASMSRVSVMWARGPDSLRVDFGGRVCRIEVCRYPTNGNIGLVLFDVVKDWPLANATVATERPLPDTHVAIKSYSENKGIVDALLAAGVIEGEATSHIPVDRPHQQSVPVYALTPVVYDLVKQLPPRR